MPLPPFPRPRVAGTISAPRVRDVGGLFNTMAFGYTLAPRVRGAGYIARQSV